MHETSGHPLGDKYDQTIRSLDGVPGVIRTTPTTLRVIHPMLGTTETYIVRTFRRSEDGQPSEDTIFVEFMSNTGPFRFALPPKVANAIARQRDALTTKSRKRGALRAVETRNANAGVK